MKLIIEARLECDGIEPTDVIPLAVFQRNDDELEQLGLSLADGRELLAATQSALVSSQASVWVNTQDYCHECYTPLRRKDSRAIVMRSVFGKVQLNSPRFWCCDCKQTSQWQGRTISPLAQALPKRVTPELEYLQTRWAAHLPYAAATALLKEVLPLQNSISASGTRQRIRTAGEEIDIRVEQGIARLSLIGDTKQPRESGQVTAISIDSAWLKHYHPTKGLGQQVNVAAGRATLADGSTRVYAYVGKRVRSGAARLDHFLGQCGVRWDERVTVISDGAGEFATAVVGSRLARGRILDWFHIAMKFRAAEQSVISSRRQAGPDWDWVEREIVNAKLLAWHGKGRKAISCLQAVNVELEKWPDLEYATLWWNVHKAHCYLQGNTRFLVNYSARYRKGLAISSSIAESAVNQIVSLRMAKKRQMRWSDAGAHALAQVRAADLNGELSPHSFGYPTQVRQGTSLRNWYGELAMAA